jgi:hypothetical protein
MKILDRRSEEFEAVMKGQFILDQLTEESRDMDRDQVSLMARRGFRSSEWYDNRRFEVSGNRLDYYHMPRHRFADMKTRQTKTRGKIRKKNHPIHNRFLFGRANNVIKRLHYGYTEAVKEELMNREI